MESVRYILFALMALIVLVAAFGTDFAGAPWYEELKAWQYGLAGVIAFAGLAIAALLGLDGVRNQIAANAREARRMHEREQLTETLRIAAAVAGEISALVELTQRGLNADRTVFNEAALVDRPNKFSAVLLSAGRKLPRLRVYEGVGHRIGLLGATAIEKLARFQTDLEVFRGTFFGGYDKAVGLYDPLEAVDHFGIYGQATELLMKTAQHAYDALQTRIAELEAERDAL